MKPLTPDEEAVKVAKLAFDRSGVQQVVNPPDHAVNTKQV